MHPPKRHVSTRSVNLTVCLNHPCGSSHPLRNKASHVNAPTVNSSDLATLLQSIPSDTTQMTTEQAQAVKDAADVLKITPDELLKFRSNP